MAPAAPNIALYIATDRMVASALAGVRRELKLQRSLVSNYRVYDRYQIHDIILQIP